MLSKFDDSGLYGFKVASQTHSVRELQVPRRRYFANAPALVSMETDLNKNVQPSGVGKHGYHILTKVNPGRVIYGCGVALALLWGVSADVIVADITLRFAPRGERFDTGIYIRKGLDADAYEEYRVLVLIASVFQHVYNVNGAWFRYHRNEEETIFLPVDFAGFDLTYNRAWALANQNLIRNVVSRVLMQVALSTTLTIEDVLDMLAEFSMRNLAVPTYLGNDRSLRFLPLGQVVPERSREDYLFSSACLSLSFPFNGNVMPLPLTINAMINHHMWRKSESFFSRGFFALNVTQRVTLKLISATSVVDRLVEAAIQRTFTLPLCSLIRGRMPDSLDEKFFKEFNVTPQVDGYVVTIFPSTEVANWQRAIQFVNLLLSLYPDATIFGGVGDVPDLGNFLERGINRRVDFNVLLDRAWYGRQGGFRITLPPNIQATALHGYADRQYAYHWVKVMRSVQDWLHAASH